MISFSKFLEFVFYEERKDSENGGKTPPFCLTAALLKGVFVTTTLHTL